VPHLVWVNKIFWKNVEEAVVTRYRLNPHRMQARDNLNCYVMSVASGIRTYTRTGAVVKEVIINFFHKNFFLPCS